MVDYSEFLKDYLKNTIKPYMKASGFKCRGQHFYIENEFLIKYISIVKSSFNINNNICFWFETSLFDKTLFNKVGHLSRIPKIPHNTIFNIISTDATSIGYRGIHTYALQSLPNTTDYYERLKPLGEIDKHVFTLIDSAAIKEFDKLVKSRLADYFIPFIESFNKREDIINEYANPPRGHVGAGVMRNLALGIHLIENNQETEGLESIQEWMEFQNKSDYWSSFKEFVKIEYLTK